mgnify:CR=1 FL=1|jgi:hypothetical protein
MSMTRRHKWIISLALITAIGTTLAFTWEECLRSLIYHRPLHYDRPFLPAIATADRIVVRADGFDCCGKIGESNVLFQVTDAGEVATVRAHIAFQSRTTTNAFLETCMCCGGPGIDWYNGNERIALTAMQHGHSIRWRGFSTARILGIRFGYGDGPLTEQSQQWIRDWLKSHGAAQNED